MDPYFLTYDRQKSSYHALVIVCLLSLGFSCTTPRAFAQPNLPRPGAFEGALQQVVDSLDRKGDLTLRNSTLEAALFTISDLWNVNIVVGEVEGSVTGVFKEAPLREILDSILLSNGYAYRPVGGSLVVSSIEELGQINPFFVSATVPVSAASIDEVLEAAQLMSTPQGEVRAIPSAGAILVVDFPDRVAKIKDLVNQIDAASRGLSGPLSSPRELEVAYFHTHYIPAAQAQLALAVVLSPVGQATSMEKEDRLLVVDYAENVRMVESVLSRIDRPRPQVNIRALIYDINLTDLEEIGVNWNLLTRGDMDADGNPVSGSGLKFDALNKTPFDAGSAGSSFSFFSIENNINLETVILALQQANDSRLLADPNVTVLDNETASIESVEEIPFQQLTQTSGGGQIGTTSFRDAGIKLEVLPKISRDGTIDLTVSPEFSRLAGFTPNDSQPIIDTRRATTRVRVSNGQTLMIAGMRQRSDTGNFNGVPVLKDVRFFGHLFRARDSQIEESELVVFLTPEIIGFSDPLGHRDQLSAETIDCRLDRIPAAEGCCPHGAPHGGYCPTCHGPAMEGATTAPVPAAPIVEESIEPIYPETSSTHQEGAGELRYPVTSVTPASVETELDETKPRLPDYEARFQGKGKLFGKHATPEEIAAAKALAEGKEDERPWHEQIFRQ